jgi:Caspase domain
MVGDGTPGGLPDPSRSRAILVGGSKYTRLPALSSVQNNVGALARILRDPDVWGLPEDNCDVVLDPKRAEQLVEPIQAAAAKATDTLLVYYAGHGLTDRAGDLSLTVTESDAASPYSQVPYQWVRDPIRESQADRRIVILDCCYSGRAAGDGMGDDSAYAAQAVVDGSFILTATPANREAQAPANQRYTAFTHELVTLLGEGLAHGGPMLTLSEIFNHLKARLRASSRPQPQANDRNNLGAQTCFRNKAFVPGRVSSPPSTEPPDAKADAAGRRVRTACLRASAPFLRSERLPAHGNLYVRRPIDAEIEAAIDPLLPINLRRRKRVRKGKAGAGEAVARVPPPQTIVLSDGPGTGKTMLAVELSRSPGKCAVVLQRAGDPLVETLERVLGQLGPGQGLELLERARLPILIAIDGLDRADHGRDQKQIIDLFRAIERLNAEAKQKGFLAFPIATLFTVRESEWDRWFTVFEGRGVIELRRRMPRFNSAQLLGALRNYSTVYEYELDGQPSSEALDRLAVPLNLSTLSESLEFQGAIATAEALGEPILAGYVRRKVELVAATLPGARAAELVERLTALAMTAIEEPLFTLEAAQRCLGEGSVEAPAANEAQALVRALIDERVLTRTARGLRFRQPGVAEYLVAARGVQEASDSGGVGALERLTARVAEASPTSSAAVRSNVEEIVQVENARTRALVSDHYATSATYAGSRLLDLRFEIGGGGRTSRRDLDSIYGSLHTLVPDDAWDAFFVVVAAANQQPADSILKAFGVAWDANPDRRDRWKLLAKLRERGLLYRDEAIARVLRSEEPRDWETFLGNLAQFGDRHRVVLRVNELSDRPLPELLGSGPEWRQARGLLEVVLVGGVYVSGQVW